MRRAALVVAALVGVAVLTLGCSSGSDAPELTEASLAKVLRDDYDIPPGQADCVARQAFARLSSDELDELQERKKGDEVPLELQRKLRDAVIPCAGAGP